MFCKFKTGPCIVPAENVRALYLASCVRTNIRVDFIFVRAQSVIPTNEINLVISPDRSNVRALSDDEERTIFSVGVCALENWFLLSVQT